MHQTDEIKTVFKILAINPGSTSTKLALYEDEQPVVEKTIRHESHEFDDCNTLLEQKPLRLACLMDFLNEEGVDMAGISAVVGRGGLIKPLDAGTYIVNSKMLKDLSAGVAGTHSSSLGGIIAEDIGRKYNIPAFIVDPVVVDEMEPIVKLSGIPGVERKSAFHALNSKAVARICAEELGTRYEDSRFIVAHLGGGITVGAHRYGRVIDVNDGIGGEGPFSPERCGAVPLNAVIEMCFSGQYSKQEMLDMLSKQGGMKAYLGTNDLAKVEKRIRQGDEFATMIVDAMAYQVAKEIGAMAVVLECRVHAIILTGGLAYSNRFTGDIKQRVDQIAPVYTYPGENEMAALTAGALRVLRGEEKALEY